MSLSKEALNLNASHVKKQLIDAAVNDGAVGNQIAAAVNERVRRGNLSLEATTNRMLDVGDLLSFTVIIKGKSKEVISSFGQRPSADALLMLLGNNCEVGDEITTKTDFVGGQVQAAAVWPISLDQASDLVTDVRGREELYRNDKNTSKSHMRRLGRLGRVYINVLSGPPLFKLPKFEGHCKRKDGNLQIGFRAGWLYKAVTLAWSSKKD